MKRQFLRLIIHCLFLALFLPSCRDANNSQEKPALTVYCAAGLRKPLEAAAAAFTAEDGAEVRFQFGGTGTLLSQIRVAHTGDLLIGADDASITIAKKDGLVREVLPFASQTPVIAVRAGNPKGIHTFDDLLRTGVRVAISNPETASVGKTTRTVAGDRWDKLAELVTVMKPTVTEIAADLSLGTVDTAILWEALIPQFQGLEAVHVPELDARPERASAAILTDCTQPSLALKFARFLAAPERGGIALKSVGFTPLPGDAWAPKPELVLYCGGINRPAVESLLQDFATREGIGMTTVFNDCGILCATMKNLGNSDASKVPDVYYACDVCFMPPVAEQFPEAILLTETDIGIAVRQGNPKGVKTLGDLAQAGLRVGLCNAEQSALGYMTKGIIKSSGLLESIQRNVVVEVPTANFLVNQMQAGALDAAIVHRINVQAGRSLLEFVPILHAGAKAIQPFAVRSASPNKQLALRLLEFLKANRGSFEKAGFLWRGDEAPIRSKEIEVPAWLKNN